MELNKETIEVYLKSKNDLQAVKQEIRDLFLELHGEKIEKFYVFNGNTIFADIGAGMTIILHKQQIIESISEDCKNYLHW